MDGDLPRAALKSPDKLAGRSGRPSVAFDLAALDQSAPLSTDSAIRLANLRAIEADSPHLADALRNTTLPSHWRAVSALDGEPALRIESPGEPASWLNGSAAPGTRADALLAGWRPSGKNVGLPTIADGAELHRLLLRLPAHHAVFVFEPDLSRLAAALSLRDFSREIVRGRCILLAPADPEADLERLLERECGLLPPAELIVIPTVAPQWAERVRSLCERISGPVAVRRDAQFAALRDSASVPSPQATENLAILSLSGDRLALRAAESLARGAAALGWSALTCVADGPRAVHPLVHAKQYANFPATRTIAIQHSPAALGMPIRGVGYCWRLSPIASDAGGNASLPLAASPRVLAEWRATDRAPQLFAWACDSLAEPPDEVEATPAEHILLIADLPSAAPEASGVTQPTHRRLWEVMLEQAGRGWESPDLMRPSELLRRAERATGYEIRDDDVRSRLARIVQHVLIPSAALPRIIRRVLAGGLGVQLLGRGWDAASAPQCAILSEDALSWLNLSPQTPPRAVVFAGAADFLNPVLLHVAARGWPLVLHDSCGETLGDDFSQIIEPQRHYLAFRDSADLREALTAAGDTPRRRKLARRTRDWLLARHRVEHRLASLVSSPRAGE